MNEHPEDFNKYKAKEKNSLFRVLFLVFMFVLLVFIASILYFLQQVSNFSYIMKVSKADAIVVLTGGAERIDAGLILLESGMANRLLISGVNTQTKPQEIRILWPGREHLFDCCIDLGYQAKNTFGNAVEARDWINKNHFHSILIVTNVDHAPRAELEFKYLLPDVEIIIYPVYSDGWRNKFNFKSLYILRNLAIEYIKYWLVRLRIVLLLTNIIQVGN